MMLNAYISVLSNDAYYPGVQGLFLSWKKTNSRFPFYLLCGPAVSTEVRNRLCNLMGGGYLIDFKNSITVDSSVDGNHKSLNPRWNFTFDKLLVFEQVQFDKLVFLDADMMVLQNLDHLFEKPHMSAVCAGVSYPGNEGWIGGLNSGLMVIEPRKGFIVDLIKMIPEVSDEKDSFGDQDLIKAYYRDWGEKIELHLAEKYNVFSDYLDYYINILGYHFSQLVDDEKSIAIIHFAGESKPWSVQKSVPTRMFYSLYLIFCALFRIKNYRRFRIMYIYYAMRKFV